MPLSPEDPEPLPPLVLLGSGVDEPTGLELEPEHGVDLGLLPGDVGSGGEVSEEVKEVELSEPELEAVPVEVVVSAVLMIVEALVADVVAGGSVIG